jgi:hypothetical protein
MFFEKIVGNFFGTGGQVTEYGVDSGCNEVLSIANALIHSGAQPLRARMLMSSPVRLL